LDNGTKVLRDADSFLFHVVFVVGAEVKKRAPKIAIELGGYCGYASAEVWSYLWLHHLRFVAECRYSAIRIARLLPDDAKFISLEINPLYAAIATKLVELAGLSHKVWGVWLMWICLVYCRPQVD
jgi:hypothetical protein